MAITTRTKTEAPATPTSGGSRTGRIVGALALGLGSGLLANLAFPPFGLWPLIFVAFVPMVVGMYRVAPARWGKAVFGVALGAYLSGQLSAGLADGEVAAVFQLMPFIFGVVLGLIAWRSRAFHDRTDFRWLPVTFPLAWVAVDFVRAGGSSVFNALGGTWVNPVYALFRQTTFLQPISLVGVYALELLVLVINFTIGALVIRRLDGKPLPRVAPAVVGAVVVVWALLGALLIDSPSTGARTIRVAAVQPGTDGDAPRAVREAHLERAFAQTKAAAAQGAQLVVWNEGGINFDPRERLTDEIRALARDNDVYIVIGMGFDDARDRHHNEAMLLSPDGTFGEPFGKDHPGTFAGDYSDTQGTYPVNRTAIGPIGTVICYDMDFTDTARRMTRKGARLIAAPSNDVDAIAETHYTHLVFRAIENRVPTVKADSGYDSAIIDQWGRLVKSTTNPSGMGQRTLVADVALGSGTSPFVSLGDWFGWLAVAATAVVVLLSRLSARRRRAADG